MVVYLFVIDAAHEKMHHMVQAGRGHDVKGGGFKGIAQTMAYDAKPYYPARCRLACVLSRVGW